MQGRSAIACGIALLAGALAACGGEEPLLFDSTMPDMEFGHILDGISIAIDPEGLTSGEEFHLVSGSEIMIMNADNTAHQITSDSHGSNDDPCAELSLPVLQPFERITFTISGPDRVCSFHDRLDPNAWWFHATVNVVQSQPAPL